ncbi:MAG TPA: Gfo/Idh/MocA family oxidoreductase [Caulobacteraceae bacterium]|nr:Gfo/Idh/MocA family oxidoreductase [Caulobacteraceae bacterium]
MNSGPVRIGLLGAGAMGAVHADCWSRIEGVELAGVFSRDLGRARRLAETAGVRPVAQAAELISDPAIDAIDVCLPSAAHAGFVVPALEAGKHVFCETPLAVSMDDAVAMRAAARRSGKLLQVGLLMRSVGSNAALKAAVDSGVHGRLVGLTAWRLGSYLRPASGDHKAHYSDPALELMTFDFDLANWLMGPPRRLFAAGQGEVAAVLDYGEGRSATILASGAMPAGRPFGVGLRALFEGAVFEQSASFEGAGPPKASFTLATDQAAPQPAAAADPDPYEAELGRFADCLRGRADPALLDVDRAIEALRLSLAARRSLAQGRPVEIS